MNDKTPAVKGLRTGLQAAVGVLVTFLVGLVLAVWNVPGVPETVLTYVGDHLAQVLLVVGIPSGLVAYVQNRLGK
jgi:hypothetical protein